MTDHVQGALLVGRDLDEGEWSEAVARDDRPRHYAFDLARRCSLDVMNPINIAPGFRDRLCSLLIGRADTWAVARAAANRFGPDQFVYATDESLGVPYLLLGSKRRRRAKSTAIFVLAPHRLRSRLWLSILRRTRLLPAMLVVGVPEAAQLLEEKLGSSNATRVVYLPVTIDDEFFRPGETPANERPLVISAGLEQRDYRRLAEATRNLDVDVDVCAVSPDRAGAKTQLPDVLPNNMRFAPLSMTGLRDLYQRADLFVLSTIPNGLGAGLTAVMEALASGVDVVVSIDEPDLADLVEEGLVTRADDPSAEALERAIVERLARPPELRTGKKRLSADDYVSVLARQFADCHGLSVDNAPDRSTTAAAEERTVEPGLLSVIIPVAGADEGLVKQLSALFDQESTTDFEVIISHNMPSAADRERLTELIAPFDNQSLWVVESNGRASAAHARNAGAAAARGSRFAFCDADDVVHDGWIDAMNAALDDYDAVTGSIVEIAPPGQDDWRPPATPDGLPTFHGAPYVLSGNLGIDRDAFNSVGGFDETLTRCEDIAIGWALQNRGLEVGFAPDAVLDYHHRAGLRKMLQQHYLYGRGMAEVLSKYPNPLHSEHGPRGRSKKLALLKPNSQPHRRTLVSEMRRVAIGLGRAVGLVAQR